MSKIFFLEYMQADFDDLKDNICQSVKDAEFTVISGKNVDIKEFIRVKMRGIEQLDFSCSMSELFKIRIIHLYCCLKPIF